jgi:hypothetical protein
MDTRDCSICFENFKTGVTCYKCNTNICSDCMVVYSNATSGEMNKLPVCTLCSTEFNFYSFSTNEDRLIYAKVLMTYLKRNKILMSKITKGEHKTIQDAVNILRENKLKTLKQIPAGVLEISKVIYPDLYKTYMSENENQIQKIFFKFKQAEEKPEYGKDCFHAFCNGHIQENSNGNYTCFDCKDTFCNKCEKVMFENHVCKEEDLESVNYINGLLKCPTCHIPCVRVSGCTSLTCSNCKTKFSETGGEGYGGHYDKINLKYEYSLYDELKDKIPFEIEEEIKRFETFKPRQVDYNVLSQYVNDPELTEYRYLEFFDVYSQINAEAKALESYVKKLLDVRKLQIDNKLDYDSMIQIFIRP